MARIKSLEEFAKELGKHDNFMLYYYKQIARLQGDPEAQQEILQEIRKRKTNEE